MSLAGRVILVTRPQAQAGPLCRLIEQQGGRAVRLPAMAIMPIAEPRGMQDVRDATVDILIFCSRNAALHGAPVLFPDTGQCPEALVLALGPGTAAELRRCGVEPVAHAASMANSEGLLAAPELAATRVRGRLVVLIKGERGRPHLQKELRRRGARLRIIEVYRRILPAVSAAQVEGLWRAEQPDTVVVTSNEGLQNLCCLTPDGVRDRLRSTRLVALTAGVAQLAGMLGFVGAIRVARETSDTGLLQAIVGNEQCDGRGETPKLGKL